MTHALLLALAPIVVQGGASEPSSLPVSSTEVAFTVATVVLVVVLAWLLLAWRARSRRGDGDTGVTTRDRDRA